MRPRAAVRRDEPPRLEHPARLRRPRPRHGRHLSLRVAPLPRRLARQRALGPLPPPLRAHRRRAGGSPGSDSPRRARRTSTARSCTPPAAAEPAAGAAVRVAPPHLHRTRLTASGANFTLVTLLMAVHVHERGLPTRERKESLTSGAPETTDGSLVKSAARTLDIFELLAAEPHGLTISEISARLGFARSSATGSSTPCSRAAISSTSADGRFQLGVRLIQLGLNVVDRLELRTAARGSPGAARRAARTTLRCSSCPEAGEILYVDKVDQRRARRSHRSAHEHRGGRCTARASARRSSRPSTTRPCCEVVRRRDARRGDRVTRSPTRRRAARGSRRTPASAATRSTGRRPSSASGASARPLRDHTGRSVAAISLSTIKEFFDPGTLGAARRGAAVEISRAMGWKGDAADSLPPGRGLRARSCSADPAPAVVEAACDDRSSEGHDALAGRAAASTRSGLGRRARPARLDADRGARRASRSTARPDRRASRRDFYRTAEPARAHAAVRRARPRHARAAARAARRRESTSRSAR